MNRSFTVMGALLLLGGCGSAPEPAADPVQQPSASSRPTGPGVDGADSVIEVPSALEAILELEDTRGGEVAQWKPLLSEENGELRARAARALGRLRRSELAQVAVVALDDESDPGVQGELLFALGQMGRAADRQVLERWLTNERPELRARAAEALGKLGDPAACSTLLEQLGDADPRVRGASLLSLCRLRGRRVKPPRPLDAQEGKAWVIVISKLAKDPDAGVRWRAVYVLANVELPGRLSILRNALAEEDSTARLFAVRGLGRLDGDTMIRGHVLCAHLEKEKNPHVAAAAAQTLATLGAVGDVGGIQALVLAASREAAPSDHHVRRAALAALGQLAAQKDPPLVDDAREQILSALTAGVRDTSLSARAEALLQLAKLDPEAAQKPTRVAAQSPDGPLRAAAAAAAAASGNVQLLGVLAKDPDPRVSSAALAGLGEVKGEEEAARAAALTGLGVDDLAVRGTALSVLQKMGRVEDIPRIATLLLEAGGSENVEVRAEAVVTLAKLASMDGGRESGEARLRDALTDSAYAVRLKAAEAIGELTGSAPPLPAPGEPARSTVPALVFGPQGSTRPTIVLETTKGELHIELYPEEAPRHVWSLLDRAIAGKHDGLIFHRIVTGFVAQGLDPRGDGWGSDGVLIRDEINPIHFLRGTLGMPNSGPDTAGCQIFVTHVPTPHLDGRYTVFGRVVEGFDVLDALDVGDKCLGVQLVE